MRIQRQAVCKCSVYEDNGLAVYYRRKDMPLYCQSSEKAEHWSHDLWSSVLLFQMEQMSFMDQPTL